ncbi:MAG: hypothetical protein QME96_07030 [Myxococcota bacterium]|nr:hypothetical protein [Myxococcota bacterium]
MDTCSVSSIGSGRSVQTIAALWVAAAAGCGAAAHSAGAVEPVPPGGECRDAAPAGECGEATPPVVPDDAPPGDDPLGALTPHPPDGLSDRDGSTPELALQRCGTRASYEYVAGEFECPEGGNPLGGDPRAGARARLGNVGSGPDGHILDLYEVPCRSGPVQIYVDMYHCKPGTSPFQ